MIKYIGFILILIFFISCGGGSSASSCTQDEKNLYVYNQMHGSYFWYNQVPNIDYRIYSSESTLLEALKYKTYDKWSYITTKSTNDMFYGEGKYRGFGFGVKMADNNRSYTITHVYTSSPSYRAGFQRGYKVLKHDNIPVSSGISFDKDSIIFTYEDLNHVISTITIDKDIVTTNSVFKKSIFTVNNKKVGYFIFNSFITPSYAQLDELFLYFKNENIEEIIIDLRFNGGGSIDVAQYLATYLGGTRVYGKLFGTMIHNAKESSKDNNLFFYSSVSNPFNNNRIFVITSSSTCSASELVINSLKASANHIDVISIGDTTCGKPVGMYVKEFCNKILAEINFKIDNSDGVGSYFSGLDPTCSSEDNLSIALGDTNETMLSSVFYYIEHGGCKPAPAFIKQRNLNIKKQNDTILNNFQREIGAI